MQDFSKIAKLSNLTFQEIHNNPNRASDIIKTKSQESPSVPIDPQKLTEIIDLLKDFSPSNMNKLRQKTFIYNNQ
jgi:hypothetical protein